MLNDRSLPSKPSTRFPPDFQTRSARQADVSGLALASAEINHCHLMTTRAFVQSMMELQPSVRSTDCVILARCRTRVFEFPRAHLLAEHPLQPAAIMGRSGARATVVSDLPDYFLNHTPFRHFRICCSLRSKIDDVLSKRAKNSGPDRFPLFVVVEQETPCETPLENGTSYIVDQGWITGGREGEGAVTVTGWCQLRVASSFLL